MKIKNKKGWLRIVEAFIAVFIIISVALLVIDKNYIEKRDISEKVYAAEVQLLQEIIDEYGKEGIKDHIDPINDLILNRRPEYLECYIQYESEEGWFPYSINIEIPLNKDIYVQTLPILEEELLIRISCWLK